MISSIRRSRERKQWEPGLISCIYLFRLLLCSPVPLRLVQKTRPNPPIARYFKATGSASTLIRKRTYGFSRISLPARWTACLSIWLTVK